jgi:hypothetical protein
MRHRGMSWLLVRLMQRVVQVRVGSEWAVMLSLVLLKKSTKLLASLGKYLHYGKNDIGLEVAARDQARFFKTTDYHKVCELIDKEIAVQRKQLDIAIESVYVSNVGLLKRADFSREFKEEATNQPFFEKCIIEFLREAVKTGHLGVLPPTRAPRTPRFRTAALRQEDQGNAPPENAGKPH